MAYRMFQGLVLTGLAAASVLVPASPAQAQAPEPQSCDDVLLPLRESRGQQVGPESCVLQAVDITVGGRAFRRLDVGLDGTVEGYLPKTGNYINYFTSAPDLVFPQGVNPGPIHHGVGKYTRAKGAAMIIVYPRERRDWNGKMWVTAHGRGRSFKRGNIQPWHENFNAADPMENFDKYEKLMAAKGYVLVKTYRSSDTLGGDIEVTLEDGTFYPEKNLNDNAQYVIDFAGVAKRIVDKRLGRAPARTYFYGHSAGGRLGRALNYVPGLNLGPAGRPVFDAVLADDSATGLWLPVVMKDGEDVLFATEAEKAAFVPQIEVIHQMYNRESPGKKAPWVSPNYLENKRRNAWILQSKGLGAKHRMYEMRSISHSGGETLPDDPRGDVEILDLSKMMDRFIDMLDAWADKGVAPPPTRSDWAKLGDADRDGTIENPAVAFPEVACPLGVYFQYPPSMSGGGVGSTFFAAFTGQGLEPLDGRDVFADMNRNGVWDFRETPTDAWRRLGLLQPDEELTRATYVSCVQAAVDQLRRDGFFSDPTARWYVEQARKADLQPLPATR